MYTHVKPSENSVSALVASLKLVARGSGHLPVGKQPPTRLAADCLG